MEECSRSIESAAGGCDHACVHASVINCSIAKVKDGRRKEKTSGQGISRYDCAGQAQQACKKTAPKKVPLVPDLKKKDAVKPRRFCFSDGKERRGSGRSPCYAGWRRPGPRRLHGSGNRHRPDGYSNFKHPSGAQRHPVYIFSCVLLFVV